MKIHHAQSCAATGLLLTIAVGMPGIAVAQSMFDGPKEKAAKAAEQVGEAVGAAADSVGKATNKAVETGHERGTGSCVLPASLVESCGARDKS